MLLILMSAFVQALPLAEVAGPRQEPSDSLLLEVAAAIEGNRSAVDAVWPGFWSEGHIYGLYPFGTTKTLVISGSAPEGELLPIPSDQLPRDLSGRAYTLEGLPTPFVPGFDLDVKVGDISFVAASIYERVGALEGSMRATLFFLFHESFHRHQQQHLAVERWLDESANGNLAGGAGEDVSSSRVQEGLARERALLRAAVTAPDPLDLKSHLREYYRSRESRFAAMNGDFTRIGEEFVEWQEGVANYVAYLATLRATGDPPSDLVRLLAADLMETPVELGSELPEVQYARWHLYATGATKAHLLDRLGVSWRERIVAGDALDSLVQEALAR